MDNRAYWVWLQKGLGAGSGKIRRILECYFSVEQFYEAGSQEWRLAGIFTRKEQEVLSQFTLEQAQKIIDLHEQAGCWVITPDDEIYPEKLRNIYDFPAVLYGKGVLPDIDNRLSIAIVGTRKATKEGQKSAYSFGKELALHNAIVVSGGAIGVDGSAHRGVLSVNGETICVLGCGVDYNYPVENAKMRDGILSKGAVISEYPIGAPPLKGHFPIRNRIISGLCDGVLVVEAGVASGSLLTAQDALEQNRDVFAIPGSIYLPNAQGTNNLIQNGAKAVSDVMRILEEYLQRYPDLMKRKNVEKNSAQQQDCAVPAKPNREEPILSGVSEAALQVYSALCEARMYHLSEILEKTGLPVQVVMSALTELEVNGFVQTYSGNRYQRS